MSEFKARQAVRNKPFAHDQMFAEMFDKDRFDDGIPLDELGKHLRRSKSYQKLKRKRRY